MVLHPELVEVFAQQGLRGRQVVRQRDIVENGRRDDPIAECPLTEGASHLELVAERSGPPEETSLRMEPLPREDRIQGLVPSSIPNSHK